MTGRILPNLGLKAFYTTGESGWGDDMSLNLLKMSVLTQGGILAVINPLPTSPNAGDVYIVATTGLNQNNVAVFDNGAWVYFTPSEGWLLYNKGTNSYLSFSGTAWVSTDGEAATAYGLQWAVWFNATPQASELLALYVSPVTFVYPANFSTSATAPPIVLPTATVVLNIDRQVSGSGAWNNIGTIAISPNGQVSLATTSGAAITINAGDRLRVIAPASPDSTLAGFALTMKGIIE